MSAPPRSRGAGDWRIFTQLPGESQRCDQSKSRCISSWPDRFCRMIPALLLVFLVVVYRVITGLLIHSGTSWLSNFTPLAAIALCSAAYLPNKYKFSVPLLTLFISDVIINLFYAAPLFDPQILVRYVALVVVGFIGFFLRNRASLKTLLPASIATSVLFYGITNTFSWLSDPGYSRNFAGLIQSLTVGLPQYGATPTWMFFRNSLVSDLIFTCLFVVCMNAGRSMGRSRGRTFPRLRDPVAAG